MSTPVAQKLNLKPGQQITVMNVPQGYLAQLTEILSPVPLRTEETQNADAVLLFVNNLAETEALSPAAIGAVKRDGLLWIAYPKGTSGVKTDVNRDKLWPIPQKLGWKPVRQVAIDETWSALRFRPAD
jgi:hypothetical protein